MAKRSKTPQKTYVLLHNWSGTSFDAQFNFNATDDYDAKMKAIGWALYHSFDRTTVCAREATETDTLPLRNEWVR